MRHGEAEQSASSDSERNLTRTGEDEVSVNCQYLQDSRPELIICSTLVRAQQTAEIVAKEIAFGKEVIIWEELVPSGKPEILVQKLSALQEEIVLLVSHQPLVSKLVTYLCDEKVYFDTGQIACVIGDSVEKHCCRIEWLR